MRKVDPTIKVPVRGGQRLREGMGGAEKKSDSSRHMGAALLTNCPSSSEGRTTGTDGCLPTAPTTSTISPSIPTRIPPGIRRGEAALRECPGSAAFRRGGCPTAWAKPLRHGTSTWTRCRRSKRRTSSSSSMNGASLPVGGRTSHPPPGMVTPLSYALFLHELFRHSDMVAASCPTGGLYTVLIDITGEAVGFAAEGLVMKIMATHFAGALPVTVSGNSPQPPMSGTPFVDIPSVPSEAPPIPWMLLPPSPAIERRSSFPWSTPRKKARSLRPRFGSQTAWPRQAVADRRAQRERDERAGQKACCPTG